MSLVGWSQFDYRAYDDLVFRANGYNVDYAKKRLKDEVIRRTTQRGFLTENFCECNLCHEMESPNFMSWVGSDAVGWEIICRDCQEGIEEVNHDPR